MRHLNVPGISKAFFYSKQINKQTQSSIIQQHSFTSVSQSVDTLSNQNLLFFRNNLIRFWKCPFLNRMTRETLSGLMWLI
jgi:hypothetical protein